MNTETQQRIQAKEWWENLLECKDTQFQAEKTPSSSQKDEWEKTPSGAYYLFQTLEVKCISKRLESPWDSSTETLEYRSQQSNVSKYKEKVTLTLQV